jgi:hypothetical protein
MALHLLWRLHGIFELLRLIEIAVCLFVIADTDEVSRVGVISDILASVYFNPNLLKCIYLERHQFDMAMRQLGTYLVDKNTKTRFY